MKNNEELIKWMEWLNSSPSACFITLTCNNSCFGTDKNFEEKLTQEDIIKGYINDYMRLLEKYLRNWDSEFVVESYLNADDLKKYCLRSSYIDISLFGELFLNQIVQNMSEFIQNSLLNKYKLEVLYDILNSYINLLNNTMGADLDAFETFLIDATSEPFEKVGKYAVDKECVRLGEDVTRAYASYLTGLWRHDVACFNIFGLEFDGSMSKLIENLKGCASSTNGDAILF